MPIESAAYIHQLEPAYPASTDQLAEADNHLRLIKAAIKNTFPNINGPVTSTDEQLNAPFAMPVGMISIWYGTASAVPAGWAICNGQTVGLTDGSGTIVTPDLRNRVVIGAGSLATQGQAIGATTTSSDTGNAGSHIHAVSGGAHTITGETGGTVLTADQLPPHRHFSFTTVKGNYGGLLDHPDWSPNQEGSGSSSGASYYMGGSATEPTVGRTSSTGSGAAHKHSINVTAPDHNHTVGSGGAHAHSVTVSTMQPSMGLHFIMKV